MPETPITFYGLKSCDTCRRALKALAGRDMTVVDVRADGVPAARLEAWLAALGSGTLINRKSTTWRGLSETDRTRADSAEGAAALLATHPTLMKRPVIETDGRVHVGWAPDVQAALGLVP